MNHLAPDLACIPQIRAMCQMDQSGIVLVACGGAILVSGCRWCSAQGLHSQRAVLRVHELDSAIPDLCHTAIFSVAARCHPTFPPPLYSSPTLTHTSTHRLKTVTKSCMACATMSPLGRRHCHIHCLARFLKNICLSLPSNCLTSPLGGLIIRNCPPVQPQG